MSSEATRAEGASAPGAAMQALARMRSQAASVTAASPKRIAGSKRAATPGTTPRATTSSAKKRAKSKASASVATTSAPDDEGAVDTEVEPGKTCSGCWRSYKTDAAYITPGVDFCWLYSDGRGAYCRDCANTYRIMHKPVMNLGFFELWIAQPQHRLLFWKQLISYLTLKRDGVSHVTAPAVSSRLSMLEWLFNMLQLPFPLAATTPADSAFMQAYARGTEGHFLRFAKDGTPIGLVPTQPPMRAHSSASRFVLRSQAARGWPLLPLSSLPPSFEQTWHDAVGDEAYHIGAGIEDIVAMSEVAGAASASSAIASSRSEPKHLSMHKERVAKLKDSARILIEGVLTSSGCKEKDISPMVQKILKYKADLLNSPYGELVIILTNLSGVLTAAKKLIKPLDDFSKSGQRAILMSMADNLQAANDYAEAEGLTIGAEFGSAFLKVKFFAMTMSTPECGGGLQAALAFLTSHHFPWASSAACGSSFASAFGPASVAQQCMCLSVLDSLKVAVPPATRDDNWDAQKKLLLENAKLLAATAETMNHRFHMKGWPCSILCFP